MTAIIEDALREMLSRRREASTSEPRISLRTLGRLEARPGVDLNNTAELLDLMESDDATD